MTGFVEKQRHLIRRFFTSLSRRPPALSDVTWVNENLLAGEFTLWSRLKSYDQRHSIEVARRFTALYPAFTRDQVAAALLHDIGKVHSKLGVLGRVIATIVGPVGIKFQRYHDHEVIGVNLCREAGSTLNTLRLLEWSEELSRNEQNVLLLLRQSDQI
jgi:hypothetical protein